MNYKNQSSQNQQVFQNRNVPPPQAPPKTQFSQQDVLEKMKQLEIIKQLIKDAKQKEAIQKIKRHLNRKFKDGGDELTSSEWNIFERKNKYYNLHL